ncbi:MAG: hypothetical protein V7K35_17660 [Nostoc sp.]|uniref:hypothetical protein n=1 Tax=Nostoc sp. TaxID=1180 RepID=UPI002FF767BC
MVKDWFEWHDLYKNEPKLQQRLQIVQEYISHSLNLSQPGLIRIVSVCAGDGRDLLGTLSNQSPTDKRCLCPTSGAKSTIS